MREKVFVKFGIKVLSLMVCVFIATMSSVSFAALTPMTATIGSVKGNAGEEVKLEVKFSDVPKEGVFSGEFNVDYDKTKMSIKEVKSGEIVKNPITDVEYSADESIKNGAKILYIDSDQTGSSYIQNNGVFCTITFKIDEKCPEGKYKIGLSPSFSILNQTTSTYKNTRPEEGAGTNEVENPFYTVGYKPYKVNYVSGKITVGNPKDLEIKLKIGDSYMYVDESKKEIDPGNGTKPVIIEGRTVVPIRAIVEALGGGIDWNGTERKVTVNLDNSKIEMIIDKKNMKVNNINKTNDVAPVIINNRTFLPLRFVAENVGCEVLWDASNQTITIKK